MKPRCSGGRPPPTERTSDDRPPAASAAAPPLPPPPGPKPDPSGTWRSRGRDPLGVAVFAVTVFVILFAIAGVALIVTAGPSTHSAVWGWGAIAIAAALAIAVVDTGPDR